MVKLVFINKKGDVLCKSVRKLSIRELYKKCGFRKSNDFEPRYTWTLDEVSYVTLFSKSSGRANTENKYELPPPVDDKLYFGTMVLVKSIGPIYSFETSTYQEDCETYLEDFDETQWEKMYESLMGGFDELNTTGEYETDELEQYSESDLTKTGGYLKDGFVVESLDEDEDEEEDYIEDEEEHYSDDNLEENSSVIEETEFSYGSEDEENVIQLNDEYDSEDSYESEDEFYGSELEEEAYISE